MRKRFAPFYPLNVTYAWVFLPLFSLAGYGAVPLHSTAHVKPSIINKNQRRFVERGIAAWYGSKFHGRKTSSGERFDMNKLTAAHRTLPFNTVVKVTNLHNKTSVVVRINDRGPYAKNRIIDLSRAAAHKIGLDRSGTAPVRVELAKEGDR
ncbi:MAG: septal ring lytic transglycosylase RlpA family protein [Chitinivibrionales bacterium]